MDEDHNLMLSENTTACSCGWKELITFTNYTALQAFDEWLGHTQEVIKEKREIDKLVEKKLRSIGESLVSAYRYGFKMVIEFHYLAQTLGHNLTFIQGDERDILDFNPPMQWICSCGWKTDWISGTIYGQFHGINEWQKHAIAEMVKAFGHAPAVPSDGYAMTFPICSCGWKSKLLPTYSGPIALISWLEHTREISGFTPK